MKADVMERPALPATVGGERFNAKRSFISKEEAEHLPDIVNANEIDWSKPRKDSVYSKYDSLKVGQAIGGLLPPIANTITARLKRLGMTVSTVKTANGTYAIKRLADD